ncbi:MAG: polynucleotide adenylyltransferase [Desulfobulbus propionicus]|nr:MAG: polynucleotide adenylyltransferase [Desulfobulbus propionicus]
MSRNKTTPVHSSVISRHQLEALLPSWLRSALSSIQQKQKCPIYLVGGTVRDLLLGRVSHDVDFTVPVAAIAWAELLAAATRGTFIALGRTEDAARVVIDGLTVDFSSYREGAETLAEELMLRDITINSLGLCLDPLLEPTLTPQEIFFVEDPCGGLEDLGQKRIRATFADTFGHDPLRMLRVYRFASLLDYSLDKDTENLIQDHCHRIAGISPERIQHEIEEIMASDRAAAACKAMTKSGLLWQIFPELERGKDMAQPESHHLDVFGHSLEALVQMEELLSGGYRQYFGHDSSISFYAAVKKNRSVLKISALLHDVGKPETCFVDHGRDDRITFYGHDQAGARTVRTIAEKYRWSRQDMLQAARLVSNHMRPFHLLNVGRRGEVTPKACLRLLQSVGEDLPGLFLLALADSLAGKGKQSPEGIEKELVLLYEQIEQLRCEQVMPVLKNSPLINGKDLIRELQLEPGPLFRIILDAVVEAQIEQTVRSRQEAFALARSIIKEKGTCQERRHAKS